MTKRPLHLALAVAATALVLTAAAFSRGDRWNFDFAQYRGPDRPEPKDEFRFVMVGDRNGGRVPGLMPQAFREINHLYPDFVICVGDLIDGPTLINDKINQFWKEFDDEVAILKSPFVYLPGNHDIWSPTSKGIYETRYGPTYRSFNYRGLHFITLDTEEMDETGKKIDRIDGKQLEWLTVDLEANRNARHILVFMHKPLWLGHGLDKAHRLWKDLPVHVFAGHDHRYSYKNIDGVPYTILGAIAGGMREEGDAIGRFRHYALATVRDDKFDIALIRLGGVLSPEMVMEDELPGIRLLADAAALYRDGDGPNAAVRFAFRNPLDIPVKVELQKGVATSGPVRPSAPRIDEFALDGGGLTSKQLDGKFFAVAGASGSGGSNVAGEYRAIFRFTNGLGEPQAIDFPVSPRQRRTVTATARIAAPSIDGDLADWPDAEWQSIGEPSQVTFGGNAWKGPNDLSGQFAVAVDDENVYVAVRVKDDNVAFSLTEPDGVELFTSNPASGEISFARDDDWHRVIVTPFAPDGKSRGEDSGRAHMSASGGTKLSKITAAYSRQSDGYTIEIALPRAELGWSATAGAGPQFDLVLNDRDNATRREKQLTWSGTDRDPFSSRYYGRVRMPAR